MNTRHVSPLLEPFEVLHTVASVDQRFRNVVAGHLALTGLRSPSRKWRSMVSRRLQAGKHKVKKLSEVDLHKASWHSCVAIDGHAGPAERTSNRLSQFAERRG